MSPVSARLRQGLRALRPRPPTDRDAILAAVLTLSQGAAFRALPPHDQAHLCRTYRLLRDRGVHDRDLLTAALLHDLGKASGSARVRLPDRVARVVLARFVPAVLARLARPPTPAWRRGLALAVHHPTIGSERAVALGCSERVCWLIAHHEDESARADLDLALLAAADRDAS